MVSRRCRERPFWFLIQGVFLVIVLMASVSSDTRKNDPEALIWKNASNCCVLLYSCYTYQRKYNTFS
jgi:hypothetical protein